MKKIVTIAIAALAATSVLAAPQRTGARTGAKTNKAQAAAAQQDGADEKAVSVRIEQYPTLGRQSTLPAPSIAGGSTIGVAYTGKPRNWIVLETKYQTDARCIDQLTFIWHVLLETKSATSKDKEGQAKLAPYSYFTQTVTYSNVGRGAHAASVCLHPSYLEQYGEPKAVGLIVQDSNGNVLDGDTLSEIKGIAPHTKFWDEPSIMEAKTSTGEFMIERRQGLLDRSKTIWALVNPNDYELVVQ